MAIPPAIVTSEKPDALQVQLAGAISVEQFSTESASCSREVTAYAETLYSHIYQSLLKRVIDLMDSLVRNYLVIVLHS